MPHFSADDHDADDPNLLAKLRAMLRGPDAPRRKPPTLAERFGARAAADAGGDDRRDAVPAGHGPRRGAG